MTRLYEAYPFDKIAMPVVQKKMNDWKIKSNDMAYQECFDAAMLCYMYSIARCALCNYENVRGYISKMMSIGIILALGCLDETTLICVENGFQRVWLDKPEHSSRY